MARPVSGPASHSVIDSNLALPPGAHISSMGHWHNTSLCELVSHITHHTSSYQSRPDLVRFGWLIFPLDCVPGLADGQGGQGVEGVDLEARHPDHGAQQRAARRQRGPGHSHRDGGQLERQPGVPAPVTHGQCRHLWSGCANSDHHSELTWQRSTCHHMCQCTQSLILAGTRAWQAQENLGSCYSLVNFTFTPGSQPGLIPDTSSLASRLSLGSVFAGSRERESLGSGEARLVNVSPVALGQKPQRSSRSRHLSLDMYFDLYSPRFSSFVLSVEDCVFSV